MVTLSLTSSEGITLKVGLDGDGVLLKTVPAIALAKSSTVTEAVGPKRVQAIVSAATTAPSVIPSAELVRVAIVNP